MKSLTKLELDEKDFKIFALAALTSLTIYLITGNYLIAANGIVSFIFTFVPARLERLKK